MRFTYCRASRVHGDGVDFAALERAAEEIHRFCLVDEPLVLMQRTQRVAINSACDARPQYPLSGTGHTYRQPGGSVDLSITVDVRGSGRVLTFPSTYANGEMDVTGLAGFGWTESAFALVGALASDAVTLAETAAYDACEMGDVLQLGSEFLLVEAKETGPNQLRLIRGAGGTAAAAHDVGDAAVFVVGPLDLRDIAAKIAQGVVSRRSTPVRGVKVQQPNQDESVVRLDWLATVQKDLVGYQALPGVA